MTKEEYRPHICEVIEMVFAAEHNALKNNPELNKRLKNKSITKDEYIGIIADEILDKTPDSIIKDDEL